MSLLVELPPEIERRLEVQAKARGVTLPQYARDVLERQARAQHAKSLSPEERAAHWRESVKNLPEGIPTLSDEAMSRESMYDTRG